MDEYWGPCSQSSIFNIYREFPKKKIGCNSTREGNIMGAKMPWPIEIHGKLNNGHITFAVVLK